MKFLKHPVAWFLAAGCLVLVVVAYVTGEFSREAAETEAVADARAVTQVLGRSVAEPAIPRGLVSGDTGAIDRFDRAVRDHLLVGQVRRIKIWNADGRILYSDDTRLIDDEFPLGEDEKEVLEKGTTDAEVSDLSQPENRFEKGSGGLLEVYTRITSPEGDPLLFEAYFSAADIAARQRQVFREFRPITLGGLVALLALTVPLLWALTRRLERTARDRERLLRAAADASENERRRIARDLHDGVVQDLAGTSFALSAVARAPETPPGTAGRLVPMTESLRTSLRTLRSLLVEIYPPDLSADGLATALGDLVAPAMGAGISASVRVDGADGASERSVRLVWRVAQEAIRNAVRHADPRTLDVAVEGAGEWLVLTVTDDGSGFDGTSRPGDGGGLGLRGLRDLIHEEGGRLKVSSVPAQGTTVRLEVAR
jgi:two-component system NarL family sensor kinase